MIEITEKEGQAVADVLGFSTAERGRLFATSCVKRLLLARQLVRKADLGAGDAWDATIAAVYADLWLAKVSGVELST